MDSNNIGQRGKGRQQQIKSLDWCNDDKPTAIAVTTWWCQEKAAPALPSAQGQLKPCLPIRWHAQTCPADGLQTLWGPQRCFYTLDAFLPSSLEETSIAQGGQGTSGRRNRGGRTWQKTLEAHMSNLKPLRAYPHSSCIMLAQTRKGNDQGNGFEGPKLLPTIYLEKTRKVLCNISERRRQKRSKHVTGMERKDLWETRRAETKQEPKHSGKQRKGWSGQRRKRTEGTLRLWPRFADLEDDSKPFVCYLLSSSYLRR